MNPLTDHRPTKILRLKQLQECVGLSRSSIYDRLNRRSPRHDPTFPTPVSIGASAVGWIASEVESWLHAKIAATRNKPTNQAGSTCD